MTLISAEDVSFLMQSGFHLFLLTLFTSEDVECERSLHAPEWLQVDPEHRINMNIQTVQA